MASTVALRKRRCFGRVALSAMAGKRGGFGRGFCPWRFHALRGKVALGLAHSFTGVTKSVLTLHSSGTGRMRSLCGLWFFELQGLRSRFVTASPSI